MILDCAKPPLFHNTMSLGFMKMMHDLKHAVLLQHIEKLLMPLSFKYVSTSYMESVVFLWWGGTFLFVELAANFWGASYIPDPGSMKNEGLDWRWTKKAANWVEAQAMPLRLYWAYFCTMIEHSYSFCY